MTRQIKFRAKTKANGHWVYGSLIDYGDGMFAIAAKGGGQRGWRKTQSVSIPDFETATELRFMREMLLNMVTSGQ